MYNLFVYKTYERINVKSVDNVEREFLSLFTFFLIIIHANGGNSAIFHNKVSSL